ncbi:MAG TPA: hypothetical protein VGK67_01975 [Myxococcales bacterium]
MSARLALSIVSYCCCLAAASCTPRPAPPDASTLRAADAAPVGAPQPAPTPDPELAKAAMLHEPCPAAEKGARAADDALDAQPRSAAGLYRLGEWLRLRDAHCFKEPAPARHAASAADAFAVAMRLDPARPEYVLAFAELRPEDPEASAALDALLARDPANGAARLLVARRPGTKPEDAIALLSEKSVRCVVGLHLELGDLYRAQKKFEAARDSYRAELERPCEAMGVTWAGEDLSRRAAARLGLATAALELGDLLTARRQLAWLHFDAVDAALPLVDPEVEEALWKKLEGKEARTKALPQKPGGMPADSVDALERAALFGRWPSFKALLVDEKDLDRAFPGCAQYGEDTGPRGTYALCILRELLPEDPKAGGCESEGTRGATCSVTGAGAPQPWTVYLLKVGPTWKLASSKRP